MNSKSSQMRKFILKKLEKPRKNYEQRVYNNLDKLYSVIRPGDVVLLEGQSEMSGIIKLLYVFTGFASPCNDIGGVASSFQ